MEERRTAAGANHNMAPLTFPSRSSTSSFIKPQMFFSRDLWLHALALPSAIVQHLFGTVPSTIASSPFRLPAESCPHARTLMAWPDQTANLKGDELVSAQQEVASIANAVAKYEPVWMYASRQNIATASSHLSGSVTVVNIDVEQPWIRNSGPVLVIPTSRDEVVGIDFNFNYFGSSSIRSTGFDRMLPYRLLANQNMTRISASISAEGGAFEADGQGTLITSESSLLISKRNGEWSKGGMEETFRELLGIQKTIWLDGITDLNANDYPIDRLVRFESGSTVILSRPHKSVAKSDLRYRAYEQARSVLNASTNANDIAFEIVEIEEASPLPSATVDASTPTRRSGPFFHERLQVMLSRMTRRTDIAADDFEIDETTITEVQSKQRRPSVKAAARSYLSFYLVNGGVIVPQFGDAAADRLAIEKLQELFPDRIVEPVSMRWMPQAGRGLHDTTLQWPSTKTGRWQ